MGCVSFQLRARPPTPALALRASAGASVNSAGYTAALAEAGWQSDLSGAAVE